jgi:16S rRNA (guanine966-N2)-methyltransferase
MRIVAGRLKGRRLEAPGGSDTRPTSDRARESVFNVIQHGLADWEASLDGASVVDVFSGTGALGLEALSRGAAHATFIDNAGPALAMVKKNAAHLGVWREVTLLKLDATRLAPPPLAAKAPCQVAFLDAPYGRELTTPALNGLARQGWVGSGSLCVVEVGADEPLVAGPGFTQLDERAYGAAKVVFLQYRA